MSAVAVRHPGEGALRHSAARSHVGHVRAVNEDRVFNQPDAGLWAIADGMGGHHGGDVAAQMVVDSLRALVRTCPQPGLADLLCALESANRAILGCNAAKRGSSGTTVVAALWDEDGVHIAWAGDSRAYRLDNEGAELLTRDHSVVQELIDAGLLTAERAATHPSANVITRALGVSEDVTIETLSYRPRPGERLMLCSDGLSRSLDPRACRPATCIERLADGMLASALALDGKDNVSLVIVEGNWLTTP